LKLGVVDVLASDVSDLLKQLEGRTVHVLGQSVKLSLAGAELEQHEPDWRNRLLAALADPTLAYVLMLIGIYGLLLEFYHPGTVAPGTIGAICLLLALYAFQALSINYAGLALLLLGLGLMVAEAFAPSFGVLGLGGITAFVFGSVILMDIEPLGPQLTPVVIAVFAVSSVVLSLATSRWVLRLRKQPVVSGREQLLDSLGVAMEDFTGQGRVWIHSEAWTARTDQPVIRGQRIKVKGIEDLTLLVTPIL
jgi:membrane-bound serine protease (ClpP class)